MNIGNWGHELADMRAEQEREAGIAAVRKPLKQMGTAFCVACGEDIEPERRAALPSARRCITCQGRLERNAARKATR